MTDLKMPDPQDTYVYQLKSFTVTWDKTMPNGPWSVNLIQPTPVTKKHEQMDMFNDNSALK